MQHGWASPSLPILLSDDSHIPVTSDEGSWIAVMLLFGAVCGSIVASSLVDSIGRKSAILITSLPFIASWLMIAFASSVPVLLCARFIGGLADGCIMCALSVYIGEISHPHHRGFLASTPSVIWIFGMILVNLLGSYFSIRTTALISTALPALLLLTFSWMPESPYYLIMKNKLVDARKTLQIFTGKDDVEGELTRLSYAVEQQNSSKSNIKELFTVASNRKALSVMILSRTAQQWTGLSAIINYAQIIFIRGCSPIMPVLGSTLYFILNLIFSIVFSSLMDKIGRRLLLALSLILTSLMLFVEGSYFYLKEKTEIDTTPFSYVSASALFGLVCALSVGVQTVPFLLLSELFPTNVKAFALGCSEIYFAVIAAIVSKFFQMAMDVFGLYVPFYTFSLCSFVSAAFVYVFVPETKNKTLEDIQDDLKCKNG